MSTKQGIDWKVFDTEYAKCLEDALSEAIELGGFATDEETVVRIAYEYKVKVEDLTLAFKEWQDEYDQYVEETQSKEVTNL